MMFTLIARQTKIIGDREKMKKMLVTLAALFLALGFGLYISASHAPATPKTLASKDELENYLSQLVSSGSPPG